MIYYYFELQIIKMHTFYKKLCEQYDLQSGSKPKKANKTQQILNDEEERKRYENLNEEDNKSTMLLIDNQNMINAFDEFKF